MLRANVAPRFMPAHLLVNRASDAAREGIFKLIVVTVLADRSPRAADLREGGVDVDCARVLGWGLSDEGLIRAMWG